MKSLPKALVLALSLMILAGTACECGDAGFQGAAPKLEHYAIETSDSPPALETYDALPDSDTIVVDFGEVDVGSIGRRYLFLRNEGRGDLNLMGFEYLSGSSVDFVVSCMRGGVFVTDCGFSADNPLAIVADADLIIEVLFAPVNMGQAEGGFVLDFNTPEHNQVTVNLRATAVTPEIQACFADCVGDQQSAECQAAAELCNDEVGKDQFILPFGDAEMETVVTRDLTLRNLGERVLSISGFSIIDPTHYHVDPAESGLPGDLGPGEEATIQLTFEPQFGGEHVTNLLVNSNDVNEPQLSIALQGRGLAPRVCPDPLALDFGVVTTGSPVIETVVVESCGLQPVLIDRIVLSDESSADFELQGFSGFPVTLDPGQTIQIDVQYYPLYDGSDWGSMEIYSNDQSADPETGFTGAVSIQGRALESACDISVEPAVVAFGAVVIGQPPTVAMRVSNVGNSTCTLDHVEISTNSADNEFSLINAPSDNTSFGPGEVILFDVQYDPVNMGQDVGTLSIFGNDKDTDEIRVDLNAVGIPGGDGPQAVCSVTPTSASSFETLVWDGSGSYDPDGARHIAEYRWALFSVPVGSAATMSGTGATRSSQTDLAGPYTGELIVVNDIGQQSAPCYCSSTVVPSEDLWIELIWQHAGDDMDLHLLAPGGFPRTQTDCYYGNCIPTYTTPPDWGVPGNVADDPALDLDDIPTTGPENINIAVPANGTYTVFVHDYPGSVYSGSNEIYVNVYVDGALVYDTTRTVSGEDSDTYICEIEWTATGTTVNPL